MLWFQHKISVTAPSRGCHLITGEVMKAAGADIRKIRVGMCNLFVQHTSASLTVNENADPDVRADMEAALSRLVPAAWNRDGTFRKCPPLSRKAAAGSAAPLSIHASDRLTVIVAAPPFSDPKRTTLLPP
jgi:hypothetical protein